MAPLTIPKKHHAGIAKILLLPEDEFQRLLANLENAPFTFDFKPVLRNVITSVEGMPAEDTAGVVDALFSLFIAHSISDKTSEQFIAAFSQALSESPSEELRSAAESPERVTSRLVQLFGVGSISLAAKASSIMFDYDHVFYKARVLTDVRPVFGDSAEEAKAVMIIHNLRIHYHQAEQHKDFFVALDAKDVQKLIDALERAKTKAETLKTMLAAANVPYIEPE